MKQMRRLLGGALAKGLVIGVCCWGLRVVAEEMTGVLWNTAELRELLREAQWLMLPQKGAVELDGGRYWFVPENTEAETFIRALRFEDNGEAWVRVLEDGKTGETVLEDVGGVEVERLAVTEDYRRTWVLELLAPEGVGGRMDAGAYDPSRVSLSVKLVPMFGLLDESDAEAGGRAKDIKGFRVATQTDAPLVKDELPAEIGSGVLTNATVMALSQVAEGRIVYVDGKAGNDVWSGRHRAFAKNGEGPKRSVRGGMSALQGDGGLVIQEGIYAEGLDVRGRHVIVRFDGDVVLKRTERQQPLIAQDVGEQTANAPTGTVVNVIQ